MKKILFCIGLLFISTNVFALDCAFFDKTTCPTQNCSPGTFMGDDGKCYDCNTNIPVEIACLGHKKLHQLCPKRFTEGLCRETSVLECSFMKGRNIEEYREEAKKVGGIVGQIGPNGEDYWIDFNTNRCGEHLVRTAIMAD